MRSQTGFNKGSGMSSQFTDSHLRGHSPSAHSWLALLLASLTSLTACGGGDGPAAPADSDPQRSTVSAYTSARTAAAPSQAAAEAQPPASLDAACDPTHELAVAALRLQDGQAHALIAPPLLAAHLNMLVAAAAGDTLAQLHTQFPEQACLNDGLRQTPLLSRQLWAERGARFQRRFLQQTDWAGAASTLAGPSPWRAGETGFADLSYASDPAFQQALSPAYAPTLMANFVDTRNTRLVIGDALDLGLSWARDQAFDGHFRSDAGLSYRVPLLRITDSVVQHQTADYTANALTDAAGLTLITITPRAGTLQAFAASQLAPALQASIAALTDATPARVQSGELVLPRGELSMSMALDQLVRTRGAGLAYSEIDANLRGLDGLGGTYVQVRPVVSTLQIDTSRLTLHSAYAAAFTFSAKNVHGLRDLSGQGLEGSSAVTVTFLGSVPQCGPTVDLRSFFIAIVDAHQAVMALAAITAPEAGASRCY